MGGGACDQIATCFVMGWNSFGQLGTHGTRDEAAPHALYAPNGEKVVGVAVGGWHSALLTASAAYVMGSNSHRQLGLGPAPGHACPRKKTTPAQPGHPLSKMGRGGGAPFNPYFSKSRKRSSHHSRRRLDQDVPPFLRSPRICWHFGARRLFATIFVCLRD